MFKCALLKNTIFGMAAGVVLETVTLVRRLVSSSSKKRGFGNRDDPGHPCCQTCALPQILLVATTKRTIQFIQQDSNTDQMLKLELVYIFKGIAQMHNGIH